MEGITLTMKRDKETKKIKLPKNFFSKGDSVNEMNKKVIAYAKDLGYMAVSYVFPFANNSKHKLGEVIKL